MASTLIQGAIAVAIVNKVMTMTTDEGTEQRLSNKKELGRLLNDVTALLDSGAITLARRKYQEFINYLNESFSLTLAQNKALSYELANIGARPAPLFTEADLSRSTSWAARPQEQLPVDKAAGEILQTFVSFDQTDVEQKKPAHMSDRNSTRLGLRNKLQ